MDSNQIGRLTSLFDGVAATTEDGVEFWSARELGRLLGYTEFNKFVPVIKKAMISCENSGYLVGDHFAEVSEMIQIGKGGERAFIGYNLTRYACYLVAQNGDPKKIEIAFAQTYFAMQTRKQEIIEQRISDMNRLQLREQLKTSEKRLSQNIYERGVDDRGFGRIRSKGDQALFGGNTTEEMKKKYNVKNRPLADFLPPVTIAAKNLATEMTNLNVEDNNLHGEVPITAEHVQNNRSVRSMLEQRGIRPEALPPVEDIKKIERRVKSEAKRLPEKSGKLPPEE